MDAQNAAFSDSQVRDPYKRELEQLVLPPHVRTAAAVTFGINIVFTALDRYAFPSQFALMLAIRLALDAVLLFVFASGYKAYPRVSQWGVALSTGLMLLTVVYGTGAPSTTDYYVGLLLYFVGLPVLLPLNGWQAAFLCSFFLSAFLWAPVVSDATFSSSFVIHSIFLLSGGIVSVASSVILDRMRFREFVRRKEAEVARDKLAELDEAKSRFSANVHHELRTPLTLMLAPLDAMLGGEFGDVSGMQRSYLETMQKNALRLLKLINNLLDFAKIESKQVEIHRQPLEVARVIEDIVDSARPMAERKGVELIAVCASDLPPVNADPDALEKILVNLVGNALKFTDAGGRITVDAQVDDGASPVAGNLDEDGAAGSDAQPPRGPCIHLSVADTGVGIPPDQLGRVFDRFAQVDGSATRRHEGTGIGLSLVQELSALHGGTAWATSEGLGHGTQFHVAIPLGVADEGGEEVVQGDDGRALTLRRSFDSLAADLEHHTEDAAQGRDASAEVTHTDRYRTLEMERTVERLEGEQRSRRPPGQCRPERRSAARAGGGGGQRRHATAVDPPAEW